MGIVPDEGEPIGPEEPERDPDAEGDGGETPGNGESNGLGQGGILPDNGNPDNVEPINPHDPRVEIETLHQQLSQTRATLAKSVQVLQKRTAQDIQIKNLRELVEKQQGQFDSKILELQTIEKEREKEQYQASVEKEKAWEQKRKKEQAEWASQQKAWEQERRREQAEWADKKRVWEEKRHKELREKEQVWKSEWKDRD